MAPKSAAPKVAVKKPKQKSAPTGLQLSAAQWKVYSAAYSAAASAGFRQLALQNGARSLRQSRLKAAATTQAKARAAHQRARTAAIAAFAVSQTYRQSKLGHQNTALRNRIYADYQRHILTAGRLQYVYKGEKAYAHTAVMRTLTSAQALTAEQALINKAAKTAKTATAPRAPATSPRSPQVAAIQANAKAAALAAARATPKGRTAPRPAKLGSLCNSRHRRWFGDPQGYDCVAAAIASSLLHDTGHALSAQAYESLEDALGGEPTIAHALNRVREDGPLFLPPWTLRGYECDIPALAAAGNVIGFQTTRGPHAALFLGAGLIASWGEVLQLAQVITPGTGIEESWDLDWERTSVARDVA